MGFEILEKKNIGSTLEERQVSVRETTIAFGSEIANEFGNQGHIQFYIDYEKELIAFTKVYGEEDAFRIIKRDVGSAIFITCKTLSKMIPKKKYTAWKENGKWMFKVKEIARKGESSPKHSLKNKGGKDV